MSLCAFELPGFSIPIPGLPSLPGVPFFSFDLELIGVTVNLDLPSFSLSISLPSLPPVPFFSYDLALIGVDLDLDLPVFALPIPGFPSLPPFPDFNVFCPLDGAP